MRRTHLRGHPNIRKRLLIQVAAFNLGLLMRRLYSVGKPRVLQGRRQALRAVFFFVRTLYGGLRALGSGLGLSFGSG